MRLCPKRHLLAHPSKSLLKRETINLEAQTLFYCTDTKEQQTVMSMHLSFQTFCLSDSLYIMTHTESPCPLLEKTEETCPERRQCVEAMMQQNPCVQNHFELSGVGN